VPSFHINGTIYTEDELLSISPISHILSEVAGFLRAWKNNADFEVLTSGSTGAPKIIRHTKMAMMESSKRTARALHLEEGMTCLLCLDLNYIAAKMMLARAATIGMDVIIVEPQSNPFTQVEDDIKIDFASFVPIQIETIFREKCEGRLDNLECILIGGAPISISLDSKINTLSSPAYQSYGMTETLSHVALRRINGEEAQSWYYPLEGVEISLDARGCLKLRADFLPDEINTNDMVELDANAAFRWLGRIDNVINSGGVKIHPEQVENVIGPLLLDLGITNSFFVAGASDKDVLEHLGERIDRYHIPKEIHSLPEFHYTANGKINRGLTVVQLKA